MKAVDDVIAATQPAMLHVGMDEDDTRSPEEYTKSLAFLLDGLKQTQALFATEGH